MRRLTFNLLALLLIAALLNIAVALAGAYRGTPMEDNWAGVRIGVVWHSSSAFCSHLHLVVHDWGQGFPASADYVELLRREAQTAEYRSGLFSTSSRGSITVCEAGWPFRALWGHRADTFLVKAESTLIPVWSTNAAYGRHIRTNLPTRPMWTGFAANTLVYALLLAGLWSSARAVRRWRRRRRGQCTACAYPRAGLPFEAPCPECGAPAPCTPAIPSSFPPNTTAK